MTLEESISAAFHGNDRFSEILKTEAQRIHAAQAALMTRRNELDKEIAEHSKHVLAIDAVLEVYRDHPSIATLMGNIARAAGEALGAVTATVETAKHVLAEASMPEPYTQEELDAMKAEDAEIDSSFILPEDVDLDEANFREVEVKIDDEASIETVVRVTDQVEEQAAPAAAEIFDEGSEPVAKKAGRAKKPDRLAELEDAVSDRVLSRVQRIISRCAGDRNEGVFSVSKNAVQHDLRSPDIRMGMELLALRGTLEILPYHDDTWIKFRLLKR